MPQQQHLTSSGFHLGSPAAGWASGWLVTADTTAVAGTASSAFMSAASEACSASMVMSSVS
eukprot:CAMPEP_0205933286 /NCGR_PEP_ID=MMETSP1325-20131115/32601_1 /ASSEMBLY_ACC=CAM_ASM_000708 /TAXON_ID=236786 /ORGANISM="Florenciella sp., Strain RCC1007" /LENGTH=60 /DNA_ID=CAMNT_0053303121 /DNA_START=28 /DNA_END=207 /DNA_ORIENTATION=+